MSGYAWRKAAFLPLALVLATPTTGVQAGELIVTVGGVVPGAGQVNVSIHDNETDFGADTGDVASMAFNRIVQASVPALAEAVAITVAVPPGAYSISVYQDANKNGRLDTNLLGIPSETYGFSNNARGLMGKPSFADALVDVTDARSIDITIK